MTRSLVFAAALVSPLALMAAPGDLDNAFMPNIGTGFSEPLNAVEVEGDGKILIGGSLGAFQGGGSDILWRLNANGTLDTAVSGFATAVGNPEVNEILVQPDGKILVGGVFDTFGGVARGGILRLNADLTLDLTFAPSGVGGTLRYVNDIEVQSDGKILVAGGFDTVNGTFRRSLARLNADGTLDTGFSAPIWASRAENGFVGPGTIDDVEVQTDGKIVVSGAFNETDGLEGFGSVARLFADGSLDSGFAIGSGADVRVNECLVLADGRILFGGLFSNFNGAPAPFLACVNPDGSTDTTFQANLGAGSNGWMGGELVQLPNCQIIVTGIFNEYGGDPVASAVRLNLDGTRDLTFAPAPHTVNRGEYGTHIYDIAAQPDGKYLAVGWMSHPDAVAAGTPAASPGLQINGTNIYNALRFEGDPLSGAGQVKILATDVTTSEFAGQAVVRVSRIGGASGALSVSYAFVDGSATAGSDFTAIPGTLDWVDGETGEKTIVIPISADGSPEGAEDFTVNLSGPGLSGATSATVTILDGDSGPPIVSPPTDVTVNQGQNASFSVVVNSPVAVSYVWKKDDVVIPFADGASYTAIGVSESDSGSVFTVEVTNGGGTTVSAGATLTVNVPDGTIDTNYPVVGLSSPVTLAVVAPDGSVIVETGNFSSGYTLQRIDPAGVVDGSFAPVFGRSSGNPDIYNLHLLPDGKIIVSGFFDTVGGISRPGVARLNADGSLDESFNAGLAGGNLPYVEVTADGDVYIDSSSFGTLQKLDTNGAVDPSFSSALGGGTGGSIAEVIGLPGGKLLVAHTSGGGFGNPVVFGFTRLLPDGSQDPDYTPVDLGFPSISAMTVLSDGRIAVAQREGLGLFLADGTPDPGFTPLVFDEFSYPISRITEVGGRLVVTGQMRLLDGEPVGRIVRVGLDGTVDPDFPGGTGANNIIAGAGLLPNGNLLVAGSFSQFNGASRPYVASLLMDDPAVGFVGSAARVDETAGTFAVQLQRIGDAADPLELTVVSVDDSAAAPGDFVAVNETVSWAAGDDAPKTVTVTLVDDESEDGDLSFSLQASVTDGSATLVGDTFMVTITDDDSLPQITQQPVSTTAVLGYPFSLSVAVSSPTAESYQWFRGGVALGGETTDTLSIASASGGDEESYFVEITNAYGTVRSATVFMTLIPDPAVVATEFTAPVSFNNTIRSVATAPDGGAYVGGLFTDVDGDPARDHLVKVNEDGSLDVSFAPVLNGTVYDLKVLADGRILAGGDFTSVGGSSVRGLALFNPDGSPDAAFMANVGAGSNSTIFGVDVLPDGRIVAAGNISSWNSASLSPNRNLIRLNADGTLDGAYANTLSTQMTDVLALPDGRVLASFNTTSSSAAKVTRFRADRTVDSSFSYIRAKTETLALAANGDYLFGGFFLNAVEGPGSVFRVDPANGSIISGFSVNGSTFDLAVQTNGKVLAVGSFNQTGKSRIARFGADGNADPTFDPGTGFNSAVWSCDLRGDGKVWIGGEFTSYNGSPAFRLVLLNGDAIPLAITRQPADLVLDPGQTAEFSVQATGITSISYQWYRDGVELVDGGNISGSQTATLNLTNVMDADEGSFTCVVTNQAGSETSAAAGLFVLGAPEFLAQPSGVSQLAGAPFVLNAEVIGAATLGYEWRRDGVPLANGGAVSGADTDTLTISPAGAADSGTYTLAVTNGLGTTVSDPAVVSIDPNAAAFAAGFVPPTVNGIVSAVYPLPGGKVLVGGQFSSITDGTNTSGANLAVVNEDGTVDTSVTISANNLVRRIVAQGDGKILLGGTFTSVSGAARGKVARLNADLSVDAGFAPLGPHFNFGDVHDVAPAGGGKVVVGGAFFLGWQSTPGVQAPNSNNVVLLDAAGSVDPGFVSTASSTVWDVEAADGGGFYLAGQFSNWDGDGGTTYDNNFVRVDATGTLDTGFQAIFSSFYPAFLFEEVDGDIVVGNYTNGVLKRYSSAGVEDSGFDAAFNPSAAVRAMVVDAAGKTTIGGTFPNYNGTESRRLARVLPDGSLDPSFDVGTGIPATTVWALALAENGRIWVGGDFTEYNGTAVSSLILLEGDSSTGGPETYAQFAARLGLGGADEDDDSDGYDNGIEHLYGMDPQVADAPPVLIEAGLGNAFGGVYNSVEPGAGLDPAKRYQSVTYRIPKDTKGSAVTVRATRNLPDFMDGSAQATEYGEPVDDGDYELRSYYLTPAIPDTPEMYWRMEVTP